MLAELVRLDRAHHRSDRRRHRSSPSTSRSWRGRTRSMVWSRQRRPTRCARCCVSTTPAALAVFGADLAGRDALAVLALAPTPEQGARLSEHQVGAALRRAGRQRNITTRAADNRCRAAHRAAGRPVPVWLVPTLPRRQALLAVITELARQTHVLEGEVQAGFGRHPDVEIYRSQPGLGQILGARVLAEFGDDPDRYPDARARKNYSGMAPVTRTSGTSRVGAGPPRPQPPPRRRPLPIGLRRPEQPHRARAPTTTPTEPAATPTTKPYAPWPTDSSASSTAACAITLPTTKPTPGPPTPATAA